MVKKSLFLCFILLFCYGLSSAGELLSKEAVTYYNEGVKAQRGGNLAQADSDYQKVLFVDPNNPKWQKLILNNRGIIYAQQGDLDRAEAAFNEVLKMDPNYKPAQINLGFIYEKRRSRLESLEYWAKVFDLERLKPKDFMIAGEQQDTK